MDNRPIGIFDSGLGGLSAAKALEELLPKENIIYFGDNRNVPYGTRTKENIVELATNGLDFLIKFNCKAILIACGTVCANAMDELKKKYTIPIFGVIDAPSRQAVEQTKTKRIAVIATEASVRSQAFELSIHQYDPKVEVFCKPCQSFVSLVETGHFSSDDPVVQCTVSEEMKSVKAWHPDQLLLACTHFPLLSEPIASEMGSNTTLISVSAAAVKDMKIRLSEVDKLADNENNFCRWYTSGNVEDFSKYASIFLGHTVFAEQHICGDSV